MVVLYSSVSGLWILRVCLATPSFSGLVGLEHVCGRD